MNCGSCIHLQQDCMYQEFKKSMEYNIYDNEFEDTLSITCHKYENKLNKRIVEVDEDGDIKSYMVKGERNPCGCGSNVYQQQNYKDNTYGVCNACNQDIYEYKEYNEFKNWKYVK